MVAGSVAVLAAARFGVADGRFTSLTCSSAESRAIVEPAVLPVAWMALAVSSNIGRLFMVMSQAFSGQQLLGGQQSLIRTALPSILSDNFLERTRIAKSKEAPMLIEMY